MPRFSALGLPTATPQTTYDKTKWVYAGDFQSKVLNSQTVWGPPLTNEADVFTLSGGTLTPTYVYVTANGRAFAINTISATPTIGLLQFNFTTGAWTWVGRIQLTLANAAATTHAIKGLTVYDGASSGVVTGWKIVLATTGSVLINGGVYVANNVALADFQNSPTVFWSAIASNAKATYFYQDPTAKGVSTAQTSIAGCDIDPTAQKLYYQNGLVATPTFGAYDLTVSPAVADQIATAIAATATVANTTPAAYWSTGATGNPGWAANDPLVVTGVAPTAYTVTTATAAQTPYFVRDIQQLWTFTFPALSTAISAGATYTNGGNTYTCVSGAALSATTAVFSVPTAGLATPTGTLVLASGTGQSPITISTATAGNVYFNLSATSGGAALAPTSAVASGMTLMRAFGTSTGAYLAANKTGIVTGLSGTILLTNSHRVYTPTDGPNAGSLCYFLPTATSFWEIKVSDFTAGTTTLPSAATSNILGSGIDFTTPSAVLADVSPETSNRVYMTSASTFIAKPLQNNKITTAFGGQQTNYIETLNPATLPFSLTTVSSLFARNGWLFISGTTAGQRVIVAMDFKADSMFATSYLISPQIATAGYVFKFLQTFEQLFDYTDSFTLQYRTAATSTDAIFSSATGGWTTIPNQVDESGIALQAFTQFRVLTDIATLLANTPAQLYELLLGFLMPGDSSDNWYNDDDNTTQGTGSPSYVSFYLSTAYASSVPTLYARVYDTSGNQIFSANSSANPTAFQYSTNGGTSWNSLGTIPNTVGTLVRVLVTPTPSGRGLPSLRES